MRYLFISFLSIIALAGCRESPESSFENNGISLICPAGWRITDEENLDDQGYYLAIEKDGFNSSGLVSISWVNDSLDLIEWLNIFIHELESNIIYKNSNLMFDVPVNNEYNTNRSISVSFDASIIGIDHEGIIQVFHGKDRTIAVLEQEAVRDKKKNRIGFHSIEKSFRNE
jgi:hypothetical protein